MSSTHRTSEHNSGTAVSERKELIIVRIFDAPRDLVWNAWTIPKRLMKWWGPKNFTSPSCKMDLRKGGKYLFCMRSPEGKNYWSTGAYREIVYHQRIVYTDSFADEKGAIVPATYYGMGPETPLEMTVTVTFDGHNGKTTMILKHAGMPLGTTSELAEQGWNESFDKLAESLVHHKTSRRGTDSTQTNFVAEPGRQEIVMTRIYDAPRDVVFKKYTDPDLIPLWWGPGRLSTTVDKMEVRPGGMWRFVQQDQKGEGFAFHGVYHAVVAPARLVYTFEFEGMPGHVLLETDEFEELDGKTKCTVTTVFQSATDRDGMLVTGMEQGATESTDRFAELLKKE
ncbi:MAG TPA: SRPBCC domain-containing protein [Chitinivibrionales bacterium]|jgi:uncharacterized protein YndB with AHSA1/START domain|nr:SRPBCC domain-containing protein [Chitinivibrionales bacterium]